MVITDAGSGPAVVLLHAFPVNRHLWDPVIPALVHAGYRVLAPDLPGFGDAPLPEAEPSVTAMAAAVEQILTARGVEEFHLAGLSMGGYVAMEMLRRTPGRLLGLALVDTKMAADGDAARKNRLLVAERAEAEGSTEFLVEAMIPLLLGRRTRAQQSGVVHQVSSWIRATDPDAVAWAQRAMAARPDSEADLTRFAGPALVLAGADDEMSPPAEQEQIAAALPEGELVLIAGAGHLSAVEAPDAVAAALVSWVGRTD